MSTAKSMAAQYKLRSTASKLGSTLGSNQRAFKSSASNLAASSRLSLLPAAVAQSASPSKQRLKATSMTNLTNPEQGPARSASPSSGARLQRPASRSALDSIHNGMNAKYAQVQSKVLLQNIRPQPNKTLPTILQQQQQQQSNNNRITTKTAPRPRLTSSSPVQTANKQQQSSQDRAQLLGKLKVFQEQLEQLELERQELRQEIEREKEEKLEQVKLLKQEFQEKTNEHERQQEEYHKKLLEAYELADQNRRAADTVLAESRQRDEESRKKIEQLEQQLAELKEFVTMKEEMTSKMGELREQIRDERERYEEKTRGLNQMFESEKIRQAYHQDDHHRPIPVDQNSNYFRRAKPMIQSMESVQDLHEEDHLRSDGQHHQHQHQAGSEWAAGKQHQSEQDLMYGSKLSTRMQDTARSAWKKSRKFASSVITGGLVGGGLSACRRNAKQRASTRSAAVPDHHHLNHSNHLNNELVQQQQQATTTNTAEEHTSVVEVGQAKFLLVDAAKQQVAPEQSSEEHQVKVDHNNKLTIVTKFSQLQPPTTTPTTTANSSDSEDQMMMSPKESPAAAAGASKCSSERSRCASSSSGLGTTSDSTSATESQTEGDQQDSESGPNKSCVDELAAQASEQVMATVMAKQHHQQQQPISPAISSSSGCASSSSQEQQYKRHKRKSSLFKTSRVFSGSQASLNKLRSFFAVAASATNDSTNRHQQQTRQQQQQQQHQSALGSSAATLRFVDTSLNGQALEEMLKKSGQGGELVMAATCRPETKSKQDTKQNCAIRIDEQQQASSIIDAAECQEQTSTAKADERLAAHQHPASGPRASLLH